MQLSILFSSLQKIPRLNDKNLFSIIVEDRIQAIANFAEEVKNTSLDQKDNVRKLRRQATALLHVQSTLDRFDLVVRKSVNPKSREVVKNLDLQIPKLIPFFGNSEDFI